MSLFEFPELALAQIILIIISIIWILQRNDEIPLLISTFIFYFSSYRYWIVVSGRDEWANISNFGFEPVTNEAALSALFFIVVGHTCFLVTYMLLQKKEIPIVVPVIEDSFLQWLRPKIFFLGLFCFPLVIVSHVVVAKKVSQGASLALGVSYLYLFPMVLIGVATLIFCLWKFGGISSPINKFVAILILISVAILTYNPTSRFFFLAWIVASGVILFSSYQPKIRLIFYIITAAIALSLFAFAGALRNPEVEYSIALGQNGSFGQVVLERALAGKDANMLDGFVLMQQIYPRYLDFSWGMEHLEIILRPIPRALWPGKPVGGYMNKLGVTIGDGQGTIGISESLFGSFYAEGHLIGILLFSVIYATILAKIVSFSTQLNPFASILIRAIVCACLIPLLRGGDLPGIYAWFGMAFWPCFLLLWVKREDFRLQENFRFKPSTKRRRIIALIKRD